MSRYKVCVTDARHESYEIERKILSQIDAELYICHCTTPADIAEQCVDADAILLDMAPMNSMAISKLQNCKIINRYGVGYDNIDLKAASEKKLWCVTYRIIVLKMFLIMLWL